MIRCVKNVELRHLRKSCLVLSADLPKTGDAWGHLEPLLLRRKVILKLVGGARPGTYQAHFATKHVEALRQFIEPSCAEQAAERNQARVALVVELGHRKLGPDQLVEVLLVDSGLCIHPHGPELIAGEAPSHLSDSFLPKYDRPS